MSAAPIRALLLTRYGRRGASSRLRAYQYIPYLKSQGMHVTAAPLFGDYYQEDLYAGRRSRWRKIAGAYAHRLLLLLRSSAFDLMWIEYEVFPWLPATAERLLPRFHLPYVVDYDDAIYHRYQLHSNPIVRLVLRRKISVVMRKARMVIVGNDYLATGARTAGARCVEHVPTAVDLSRYELQTRQPSSTFVIGWIGSPSTAKYLAAIAPVLTDLCRNGSARLVVVGPRSVALDGPFVDVRPWSEDTEVDEIMGFDVGIMPLPDEPWERGKCGYKLIQYMACARPVIASPVGANKDIVEHGVNGFLASTLQEWHSYLETLRTNPEWRVRMGKAGRMKVEALYCTRVTAPRLAELLASICDNRARP